MNLISVAFVLLYPFVSVFRFQSHIKSDGIAKIVHTSE